MTQSGHLAQRKIRRISRKNQTLLQACCRSGGYQQLVGTTLGIVRRVRTAAKCTSTLLNGRHQLPKRRSSCLQTLGLAKGLWTGKVQNARTMRNQ